MRITALAVSALSALTLGAVSLAAPAQAGTYGGGHPVCLQVYGPLNYIECDYTSIAQCNLSASGRSAQCIANPYFANAQLQPVRKKHRAVY